MYKIDVDETKNCLVIVLDGFMSEEEVSEAARKTREAVDRLKPGFSVINDISKFKPTGAESAKEIKAAQAFVASHGVGKVIRVVDSTLAKMQFSRTQREAAAGYEVLEARSIDEAYGLVG